MGTAIVAVAVASAFVLVAVAARRMRASHGDPDVWLDTVTALAALDETAAADADVFATLADRMVPAVADWCLVVAGGDGDAVTVERTGPPPAAVPRGAALRELALASRPVEAPAVVGVGGTRTPVDGTDDVLRARLHEAGVRVWAGAPLAVHGRRVGTLWLAGTTAGCRLRPADAGRVAAVAAQAARTLDRVRAARARARDVVERRRADERLALALEAAGMAAWDVELAPGRAAWSSGDAAVLGGEPGDGMPVLERWRSALHPDDRAAALAALDEARRTRGTLDGVHRIVRRDGAVRSIAVHGRVVDDGDRPRLLGAFVDVTERRAVESALRAERSELQALVDLLPVGVFLTHDARADEITGNAVFRELLGLAPGENASLSAPGSTTARYRVLHEGRPVPADELPLQRAVRTGEVVRDVAYDVETADGHVRRLFASATPIRDESGAVRGAVGALVDVTHLMETERALRRSEARLRGIAASGLVGIASFTADGRVVDANEAYLRAVGHPRSALPLTWRHVAPSATAPPPPRAGGTTAPHEYEITRGDGTRGVVLAGWTMLDRDEGVAFTVDVTAQRAAERRLRDLTDRLALHFAMAPLAIIEFDAAFRVTAWAGEAERMFGWTAAEVVGRRVPEREWVHPDDVAMVRETIGTMVREGQRRTVCRNRNLRKDGRIVHCEWYSSVLRDDAGALVSVLCFVLDVTARVEQEQVLALAQDAGRLGVVDWDPRLQTSRWSTGLERLYGVAPGTFPGSLEAWASLVEPEDVPRVRETVAQALAARRSEVDFEFRLRGGDPVRWLATTAQCFYDAHGEPLRLVGITIDITARRAAEDALREADRRKDEFLAMLAHELRNPLAPLRNAIHLLRLRSGGDPEIDRVHGMLERQVAHMARLIDDLLDVARITRGTITLRRAGVDVAEVIEAALETARPLIERQGHAVAVSGPSEPVRVQGDVARLVQVFGNLLTNAAKFTGPGGRITVSIERVVDDVTVRVRDTGVGIAPEMQSKIFDLFVQASTTFDRAHGGLGIGLTLVHRLVELHGGSVRVESDGPGAGAEFVVTLPALPPETPERVPPPAPTLVAGMRPLRILLVEDNVDAAESFRMLLALGGHEVRVAHHGEAALALVEGFVPDVAFLDLGLPVMDGFELAQALRHRAACRATLLVAVSGYGRDEDRRRAREAGFDHHLVKPVDIDAVDALLAQMSAPAEPATPPRTVH